MIGTPPPPLPPGSVALAVTSSRTTQILQQRHAPMPCYDAPRSRQGGGIGPTATIRLSVLLNPSDGDVNDEPERDADADADAIGRGIQKKTAANANVNAKIPKKRGRKPILPSMNNSERGKYYRAKQTAYATTLHGEVDTLRANIARLVALRSISNELAVCPRSLSSGSLVKLVREYFTQFRYGVQLPPARRNMALLEVETSTTSQEIFMRATMDPDLCFGEFKGIDVVLDQWERYSKYHAFLQFEMLEVRVRENEDGHIIETSGQLRTRYSRRTIENVFPHAIGNEPLIQRLIGKEVIYPCRNQFYFTREGRVQRYNVEADFPEALQQAVGNLEDVAILLNQALIRQQHMMGELEGDELAVLEEIERRIDSTDDEGSTQSTSSRTNGGGRSRPASATPAHTMSVEFLLSDENTSSATDDMDMSD